MTWRRYACSLKKKTTKNFGAWPNLGKLDIYDMTSQKLHYSYLEVGSIWAIPRIVICTKSHSLLELHGKTVILTNIDISAYYLKGDVSSGERKINIETAILPNVLISIVDFW